MIQPRAAPGPNLGFGAYVHFPWCLSKCGYCDFFSVATDPGRTIDHDAYADAVLGELDRRSERLVLSPLTSLYIGGGTPSLWRSDCIGRVIEGILACFGADRAAVEITVECNPSSFGPDVVQGLLAAHVNRISLGIQSLDDEQLRFLGRRHDRQSALDAVDRALGSNATDVSADFLFGLPRQTLAAELKQLVELASRPLAHLSAYALTVEPGTLFGRLARQNRLPLATDEHVAEAFVAVHTELERLGYEHYEISNFARTGHTSRHNQQYWRGAYYLGLGAGAVGTVELGPSQVRYRNPANIAQYLAIDWSNPTLDVFGPLPDGTLSELEILDAATRLRERLMLGLRLREGIDLEALGRELGVEVLTPARQHAIEQLVTHRRLSVDGARLYIEPEAWLLADGTIARLM